MEHETSANPTFNFNEKSNAISKSGDITKSNPGFRFSAPPRLLAWMILAGACGMYFYALASLPLVGPDEPRYAQVAREMMLRGDFITPTLGGETWFEKPALPYWAMRLGFELFGTNERGARVGSAVAGVLTILCIGWLAQKAQRSSKSYENKLDTIALDDKAATHNLSLLAASDFGLLANFGLLAAMITSSCLGLIVFARGASFDVYLTAAITVTLAAFVAAEMETNAKRRTRVLMVCYAFAGVALLAKGLIGLLLPALVVTFYFLLQRRVPSKFWWQSLAWGVPLCLFVASVWYVPVTLRHGSIFIQKFFVEHHFARYTSNKYHHPQPIYYYLLVMPALALPYSLILLTSFAATAKQALTNWRHKTHTLKQIEKLNHVEKLNPTEKLNHTENLIDDYHRSDNLQAVDNFHRADNFNRLRLFAFAWMLAPIAFFSLSGSKLPGYILPALPGAALLTAYGAADLIVRTASRRKPNQWSLIATGSLMIVIGAAGTIFAAKSDLLTYTQAAIIALPMIFGGAAAIVCQRHPARSVWTIGVSVVAMIVLILTFATQSAGNRFSLRNQLRLAAARGYGEAPLFSFNALDRTAEFYHAGRFVYDGNGEPLLLYSTTDLLTQMRARCLTQALVMTNQNGIRLLSDAQANQLINFEIIGANDEVILVAVDFKQ